MEFNNKLKVKEFSFQTKLSGITKVISGLVLATVIAISMPACSISGGNNSGSGDNTTDSTTPERILTAANTVRYWKMSLTVIITTK